MCRAHLITIQKWNKGCIDYQVAMIVADLKQNIAVEFTIDEYLIELFIIGLFQTVLHYLNSVDAIVTLQAPEAFTVAIVEIV